MNQRILLITGWGGGTKLLNSLQHALQHRNYDVELINIFNALDEEVLSQYVEKAKTVDVIIGWSLGGPLATLLVDQVGKKYSEKKILITLASNPCFVANSEWQIAMDQLTFQSFKQSFENDAILTLKKFGYMVCQGVETTRADFLTLQSLIQPQKIELLQAGLKLLENLNLVSILKNYSGYQYHLFAKQDYLVNYKVCENLQQLAAKFLQTELISGSHGFAVFKSEEITDKICQYLQKLN